MPHTEPLLSQECVGNCVIARVQLSNGNKLSRGYRVFLMGQGAGAGNILARFRALFCKVRGDGRPNGGNGGQNWMEDRSEQGMPNVGNYSRRAWGAGLCDGGGVVLLSSYFPHFL